MKKPNGFMYFAESRKNEYERISGRGLRIEELVGIAAEDWSKMPLTEQEQWKAESRRRLNDQRGAIACAQMPVKWAKPIKLPRPSTLEKSLRNAEIQTYFGPNEAYKFEQQRRRQRETLYDRLCWEQPKMAHFKPEQATRELCEYLIRKKFCLLSVTSYGEMSNREFPPAEVVMSTFSIANGLMEEWRQLVAHEYPLTNRNFHEAAARENCGIPYTAQTDGSIGLVVNSDYNKIMCTLMHNSKAKSSEVSSRLHASYIFVEAAQYNAAQGALFWLKSRRDVIIGRSTKSIKPERIMCIEDLIAVLTRFFGAPNSTKPVLTLQAMEDRKIVSSATACDQHRHKNTAKCAQARARYVIDDFLAFARAQFDLEHDVKALLPYEACLPFIGDAIEPSDYAASVAFDEQGVLVDPDLGLPLGVIGHQTDDGKTVDADVLSATVTTTRGGDHLSSDDSGEISVQRMQVENWLAKQSSSDQPRLNHPLPLKSIPCVHPKWLQIDLFSFRRFKEQYGTMEHRPKCFGFGRGLRVLDEFLG